MIKLYPRAYGISDPRVKFVLRDLLKARGLSVRSTLDIGTGAGVSGSIIKTYGISGVYSVGIDGIELPELTEIYNEMIITEIGSWVAQDDRYLRTSDLIVFADVIEHFDVETSTKVLGTIIDKMHPGALLLLSTPIKLFNQAGWPGVGEFEEHKSQWKHSDLMSLNPSYYDISLDIGVGVYLYEKGKCNTDLSLISPTNDIKGSRKLANILFNDEVQLHGGSLI